MGRKKNLPSEPLPDTDISSKPHRKPRSLARREDQIIAMAYDEIEERIRNHTATGQELIEFAKRGSTKARLEKEIMEENVKYLKAKTEAMESAKRVEELYSEAMRAFRSYQPTPPDDKELPRAN